MPPPRFSISGKDKECNLTNLIDVDIKDDRLRMRHFGKKKGNKWYF